MMVLLSATLLFSQSNLLFGQAQKQGKTFVKICQDAQIDSKSISQVMNAEDAATCASNCMENVACNSFSYNSANAGQCIHYSENLEAVRIVFAQNWVVFAIKSKTINYCF